MKQFLSALLGLLLMTHCQDPRPQYASLDDYPVYAYDDLGMTYTPAGTTFKLWSPAAQAARLRLYDTDDPAVAATEVIELSETDGAWAATIDRDMRGTYYTFQIKQNGNWLEEAADPYARAVGTNGWRAQVVDLDATDPEGWAEDTPPDFGNKTDAIIYELHVRDASIHPNSGIEQKGKYLGLAEVGTTTTAGDTSGLSHIAGLGVTHVHLLPAFDYLSVDEAKLDEAQYNWGYDPQNYNVPEGSYSTDPSDGSVRIREFKEMVQAMHRQGLRVVMDVVYNHTGRTDNSKFELLIPGYFYRFNEDGSYSNASGCGNEIASERPMVRKYIRESLMYWVDEYHVDGFRFDLMGIHDIATMNEVSEALHAVRPDILLYGEGWTAGGSPLPDSLRALKANVPQLDRIAAFSDDVRDALKGSVFEHEEPGFVAGSTGRKPSIHFGIAGATRHPQVDYAAVNYSDAPWAPEPSQCINYVSCHDNHTLWDRLAISSGGATAGQRRQMQRLALATVLMSQGISFLHAGTEFCRSKNGVENSYNSPDGVNMINWNMKSGNRETYEYVRGLIDMRKTHSAFRLGSTERIAKHLTFLDTGNEHLVAFRIQDAPEDEWADVLVLLNGGQEYVRYDLPEGEWEEAVSGRRVHDAPERVRGNRVNVLGRSAQVYVRRVASK